MQQELEGDCPAANNKAEQRRECAKARGEVSNRELDGHLAEPVHITLFIYLRSIVLQTTGNVVISIHK
jgi:hypothetical protein